ncbi:DJ-1/PfpI family protein (plasmid) [Rhizobium leguminosarum]|uniref:DJ-1/PfpI family protein n=1 Tax=Rhizobium leguminosarum TaxID=384 RepID=UPI001031D9E8|nr:DJ-1/PfpI family protein [Rhizobium leguminosarum]TAZ47089.1 DJ-1/PfpI family protein [Rhizobium leguminosarum]
MNRREFNIMLAASSLALAAGSAGAADQPANKLKVIALIYPGMILLDLAGPLTCFNMMMADIHLVSKTMDPVKTDTGVTVAPTMTLADCPDEADVLFVPGGLGGTTAMMEDAEVVGFLRSRGAEAKFVTSVCTGSLLLGAAGLLKGKRATSHWYTRDLLPLFGATPVEARVVEDGNVITGAAVTAGIDFGLTLAARLRGEDTAKFIQLLIEYDPHPPFDAGSPDKAGQTLVSSVLSRRASALDAARAAAERVSRQL